MDTISYNQLVTLLQATKGVVIVGLLTLVDARALKTGNPFPGKMILKQVRAVGFVGADYELAVNRELMRQDKATVFETAKLPWGQWLIPHKVIQHDGELYLRTQTTSGQRRKQPAKLLNYRDAQGKFLSPDDVKPFLPAPSYSIKQENAGLQDTPAQVWVRVYKFSSIQKIRIAGKTYLVKP